MVMLEAADLGVLDLYEREIVRLHGVSGEAETWSLLYQTDARARNEHLEHISLDLAREVEYATMAGTRVKWDTKRPWNEAFLRLVECPTHQTWWDRTFV